ncbi:MAG: hypothetical protein HRU22_18990, partial [Gammaproteobacteria bacterium]|nr:hypothetical protein [Gammaproteobacteria bacterium]
MRPLRFFLFIYIVAIVTANAGLATTDSLSLQSSVSEPDPQIAINKDIENYLATIEQLEFQGGIYSDNLSQNLIQLGTLYQHNDKHANAVKVFERALFLHRINDGLYSNNQVAVIEKIINSLTRLKKWNLVNDRFSHLYWLANKSLQHDHEKRLEITLKCAHWQLEAYNLRVAKIPMQSLVLGYKLFETALRISSEEYGGADLRLIEPLNGLLVSTYLAATNKPFIDPRSTPLRGYRNGINLISLEIDILQRQERLDHLRLTNAKLKLADWQLMYGKDQDAMT